MTTEAKSGTCTVSILFHGIPFAIHADIDDWTALFLETYLTQHCSEAPEQLMQIRDVDGRNLVLNTTFIKKLILVDWIRPAPQQDAKAKLSSNDDKFDPDCDLEDYPAALRMYFSDDTEPVSHCSVRGLELDNARCLFDTYHLKDVPMFSFRDEDNDLTFVNPRNIVFMEYHDMRSVNEFLEQECVDVHYHRIEGTKASVNS